MSKSNRNSGNPWTQEELKRLKFLAAHNTTHVISLKIGRTPEAIYTKASKEGISLNPYNVSPYGTGKKK